MPDIRIAKGLQDKILFASHTCKRVSLQTRLANLEREIAALVDAYRARFAKPADALPLLRPARQLYRNLNIDPTRYRPSSEALLRRLLKGMDFPRVETVVDLANLFSLTCMRPLGLYDAARITGHIELRQGKPGETYEGIRKGTINIAGKYVLADQLGPFGNPTADSLRCSVSARTQAFFIVVFMATDDDLIDKMGVMLNEFFPQH
jgi:DNA/RNA-binding domain of Phe-tRNA-synthetase-like protein